MTSFPGYGDQLTGGGSPAPWPAAIAGEADVIDRCVNMPCTIPPVCQVAHVVQCDNRLAMPTVVGRHPERARIAECLDTGRAGSRLLLIMGEAGAGKTTMLAEAVGRARALGMTVLSGAATRLSDDVPFAAVLPVIRRIVHRHELAGFLGTETVPVAAMYEAVIEGCERLAERGPVLVTVEDLHWSDTASVDLLSVLAVAAVPGVTLAVTLRDDEAPAIPRLARFVADTARLPGTEALQLGPLSDEEAVELVRAAGLTDPAQVLAGTGRIPLLVEEAIRRRIEGLAPIAGQAAEVLSDRVSQLDSAALDLVNVIAIRGRPTRLDLAAVILDREASALHTSAERARAKAVLVDTGRGLDFRHALFGETWRDRMLTDQRRQWHRRIATALEHQPDSDHAEIAAHFQQAGELGHTFEHAVSAAHLAWRAQSKGDTLSLLEIALGTGVVDDSVASRYDLLSWAATCAYALGEHQRAIDHAVEALDIAATSEQTIAALDLLGWLYFGYSKSTESRHSFEAASRMITSHTPPALEARVLAGNVMIQFWETITDEGFGQLRRMADRSWQLATLAGDRRATSLAAAALAASEIEEDKATERFVEALEAAEAADDAITWGFAAVMVVVSLQSRAAWREVVEWGERLIRRALARGQLSDHAVLQALTADNYLELGDTSRAEALLDAASRRNLTGRALFLALAPQARCAMYAGRLDEAERIVRSLDDVVLDVPEDQSNRDVLNELEAIIALTRKRPLDAAAIMLGETSHFLLVYPRVLVEAALAIRAGTSASPELSSAIEQAIDGFETLPFLPPAQVANERAEFSRLRGSDPDLWSEAARLWSQTGGRRLAAYCRLRQCEALLSAGKPRSECRRLWQHVRGEADAMGDALLMAQLDELAERAGFGDRIEVELPLSARELDVLRLIAHGYTNSQIGDELFISAKTAGAHVSNILAKLGVARRIDAAAVAHRLGLFAEHE